jgi:LCP family protein required for cell wall assembly
MPNNARPNTVSRRAVVMRVLVALISVLTVATTGSVWWASRGVFTGFTVSQALPSDGPRSSGGAVNILLIGLDSRKDQQGNDLPQPILDQLHAGDSTAGGYNTNTLILVHIAADDRVTAFSIPRDDYVAFNRIPGYHHIKIKEAYGLTKFTTEQALADQGVTDQATLEAQGREAGRAATLSAVRSLVGVPIDSFAEISLAGFYDLAATLGGIDVCLNHPAHDDYSGADFPAGRQTLNAAQSLAFVRQRHGLDNGDLDRTHRQQAFLISVMRQLQGAGTFSDLSKLKRLMAVAQKDIVFSNGWDTNQFRRLGAIAGADVQYQTLPVVRYDRINGQDVNVIDPAEIKALVQAAFADAPSTSTSAAPQPSSIVDVVNAGHTSGLAGTVSQDLTRHGYPAGEVRDALAGEFSSTAIDYAPGTESEAQDIAGLLGDIAIRADSAVPAGHVRVVLGDGYLPPSAQAAPDSSASALFNTSNATSLNESPTPTPDHGLPVDGGGVPCVN